jgi:uncharacterized protein
VLCIGKNNAQEGFPVEYAVKMKEFDNTLLFSTLAENGKLSINHILDITKQIAIFHTHAEQTPSYWGARQVWKAIETNLNTCKHVCPKEISTDLINALLSTSKSEFNSKRN